ncbi:MAG: TolC family protein [Lewinellaceae bacterium]|nr:TolC family protein [Lewinellaceae bacterium]
MLEAGTRRCQSKRRNRTESIPFCQCRPSNPRRTANRLIPTGSNPEQIALQISVPILDWGRSESRLRTADANQKLANYTVEQDRQTFEQEIYTEVILFEMQKDQAVPNRASRYHRLRK